MDSEPRIHFCVIVELNYACYSHLIAAIKIQFVFDSGKRSLFKQTRYLVRNTVIVGESWTILRGSINLGNHFSWQNIDFFFFLSTSLSFCSIQWFCSKLFRLNFSIFNIGICFEKGSRFSCATNQNQFSFHVHLRESS